MSDLNTFLLDLSKFSGEVEKTVGKITRAAAFAVMKDVVGGSPVDTGRFRASWFVGVNEPNRSITPERQVSERQRGSKRTTSGAGQESLARLQELTPDRVTGKEIIYITNNLPYGPSLAAGSSTQAPDGWIEAAVERAAIEVGIVQVVEGQNGTLG